MKKLPTVGIIDTKTSNIKSVYYATSLQNVEVKYITSLEDAQNIDAMIVPGIGNFSFVMNQLKKNNLDKYICEKIYEDIPSLFICVGMQILFTKSYEFGEHDGLNIFEGEVKKIDMNDKDGNKIRNIPMIGWNNLDLKNNCKIFNNIENESFFYFTHSYYCEPKNKGIITSTSNYLDFNYCSSVSKKNIFATQFHPEKSGEVGLRIYNNFIKII
tara:strand:- start:4159 stop:4800 length:642 start_codon:yes stop_codon:yes gene_type:complete